MHNNDTAIIRCKLMAQFIERLTGAGYSWNADASFHGHPTQIEGWDKDGNPFYFRHRSNRATFVVGTEGQSLWQMIDNPTAYLNFMVPENSTDEEVFFTAALMVERNPGVWLDLTLEGMKYNAGVPVDLSKVTVIHRNMDTLVPV